MSEFPGISLFELLRSPKARRILTSFIEKATLQLLAKVGPDTFKSDRMEKFWIV